MSEHYPYGPLTRADFESLALSYYDASQFDRQRIAGQRGIKSGDYLKVILSEMKPEPQAYPEVSDDEIKEELQERLEQGGYGSPFIRHAIEGALKSIEEDRSGSS